MRHAAVSYFDAEGRPLDPRSVPLTVEGTIQARCAADMLAEIAFDVAVCSGMPRTIETARIVLGARRLPLEEDPRLMEAKAGRLRDVPVGSIEQAVAYAYDGAQLPRAAFIGGETWQQFAERVGAGWTDLMRRPDWAQLLLVAHDAVNRVILGNVTGAGLAGIKHFEQDPACVNIIDVDVENGIVQRELLRAANISPYDLAKTDIHATVMEKIFRNYRGDG
jgi:probable phosphoglycerate mutase